MRITGRPIGRTLAGAALALTLAISPLSGSSPAWAADEYLQIQFIKNVLIPRPVTEWAKLMEQNRDLLDASFFERCDTRIQWGLQNGQVEDAIRFSMIADEAMRANGQVGKYVMTLVYVFIKSGNEDMAKQLITFLRLKDPKDPEPRYLEASIFKAASNFFEAYNAYKNLAQENYKSDECYYQMALISVLLDQSQRAEKELESALAVNPNHTASRSLLDKLIQARPKFVPDKSAGFNSIPVAGNTTTAPVSAENQKLATSLFNQAEGHHNTNQLEKARDGYMRAVQANPNLTKAHVYLGAVLYRLGDVDGAIRSLNQAIEQNKKDHDAWRYLGYSYERRFDTKGNPDDLQRAITAFQTGSDVFPEDRQFKVELQRVRAKQKR